MTRPSTSPPRPLTAVVRGHAERLRRAGVVSPDADALALAAHATGLGRHAVRTATADDVPAAALDRLSWLVERRAAREPLQLITGETGFRTITVACRAGVFVPRPETEVLAGLAIGLLEERAGHGPAVPVVVEPCTGTGAVACAIATEVPSTRVVATDVNPDAVALARSNAARLGVDVDVRHGDLLAPLPDDLRGRVDLLVANPPYLTPAEVAASEPEVTGYDPIDALVGGVDGNAVVQRLFDEGREWVASGGALVVEVGDARAVESAARALAAGWCDVRVAADLAGRQRFVTGRRA